MSNSLPLTVLYSLSLSTHDSNPWGKLISKHQLSRREKVKSSSHNRHHIKHTQASCSSWMGNMLGSSLPRLTTLSAKYPPSLWVDSAQQFGNREKQGNQINICHNPSLSSLGLEFMSLDSWSWYVFNDKTACSLFQFWVSPIKLDSTRLFVSSPFYNSKSHHANNGLAISSLVCLFRDTHFYTCSMTNSFSLVSSAAN